MTGDKSERRQVESEQVDEQSRQAQDAPAETCLIDRATSHLNQGGAIG